MDPITAAAIGGAILNIGSGLFGRKLSEKDRRRAQQYAEEAIGTYDNLSQPELEKIVAERMSTEGWDTIPVDAGNRNARNDAIRRLMEEGTSGGMSPQSALEYEQARREATALDQQGRGAIRQEMARRGLGGAGEAVLQQQAQQQAADRASMAGLQTAADARSRALAALAQGGGMAASAEQQDFNRQAAINQSRDRIAQFNAEMAMRAQQANNEMQQQQWQNQLNLADRQYGARRYGSDVYGGRAKDTARMVGEIGQGAVQGIQAGVQGAYGPGAAGGAASAGQFAPPQADTQYATQYGVLPQKKRGGGPTGAPAAPYSSY